MAARELDRSRFIELRKIEIADKERMRHWRNLPEVSQTMLHDEHITAKEDEKWLRCILRGPGKLYWIVRHQRHADVCPGPDDKVDRRTYPLFRCPEPRVTA